MSWRPSNDFRSSGPSRRDDRSSSSSTTRLIIVGGAVLLVIIVGVVIAVNIAGRSGGSVAVAPTSAPVATAASPSAASPSVASAAASPTAAAPTATAAVVAIVRSRATLTPVPTVRPADAGPATATGDAAAGEALFNQMPQEALLAGAVACVTCHNIAPGSGTLVGPSLNGVATRAATQVPILSPAQYLRTSILVPDSYVVETFTQGTMNQTFAKSLTEQQIEDLVAYLLTLK